MITKKSYKKKAGITREEYEQIHKETVRKLDEIFAMEDYMIVLAKKYYGDAWMSTLDGKHPDRDSHRKVVQRRVIERKIAGQAARVPQTKLPIVQLDLDGNLIQEWENIMEWVSVKNMKTTQHIGPLEVARGNAHTAFNSLWKFKEDYDNGK
jgi:hypothetical protein